MDGDASDRFWERHPAIGAIIVFLAVLLIFGAGSSHAPHPDELEEYPGPDSGPHGEGT